MKEKVITCPLRGHVMKEKGNNVSITWARNEGKSHYVSITWARNEGKR
jgi:hypothetical protein